MDSDKLMKAIVTNISDDFPFEKDSIVYIDEKSEKAYNEHPWVKTYKTNVNGVSRYIYTKDCCFCDTETIKEITNEKLKLAYEIKNAEGVVLFKIGGAWYYRFDFVTSHYLSQQKIVKTMYTIGEYHYMWKYAEFVKDFCLEEGIPFLEIIGNSVNTPWYDGTDILEHIFNEEDIVTFELVLDKNKILKSKECFSSLKGHIEDLIFAYNCLVKKKSFFRHPISVNDVEGMLGNTRSTLISKDFVTKVGKKCKGRIYRDSINNLILVS